MLPAHKHRPADSYYLSRPSLPELFDGLQSLFILAAGCLHLGKLNQGFAVRILPVNIIFHQRRRLSQGFFRLLIIVQTQLQFAQTGINKGFPFRIACL